DQARRFSPGRVAGWKAALLWPIRHSRAVEHSGCRRRGTADFDFGIRHELDWGAKGIYYIDFPPNPGTPKQVKFYSFTSGRSNQLGTVEANVPDHTNGISISVSPDGRRLLYLDITDRTSDLMLVDGFR